MSKQTEALKLALELLKAAYVPADLDEQRERTIKELEALAQSRSDEEQPAQQQDGPINEGWQITVAHGHSGYGVYAHMEDYPEEGAVLVQAIEQPAQPQQEPVAWTATRLWNRKDTWTCPADIEKDLLDGCAPPAQQQEPVAEVLNKRGEVDWISFVPIAGTPLYTSPQPRKPLTDEQIDELARATFDVVQEMPDYQVNGDTWDREFARAIEAKLKEKNT